MTRFVRGFYLALGLIVGSAVLLVTGQGFGGAGFGSSGGGASSADPTFTGIVTMPIAADPTTNADGECAFDADAWAAGRDALECFDGTASTYLVGVLVSDAPAAGQVPKWQTGGTITWENDDNAGAATEFDDFADPSGNGAVALVNTTHVWTSTLDSAGATILTLYNTDADRAAATSILELKSNDIADADDIFIDVIADEDGTPTSIFKLTGTGLTLTVDLTAPNIPALVDPNVDGAVLCWDDVTPDTNGCAGVSIIMGTSSTPADLRLREDTDNGTNYISLIAPASIGSNAVITLPEITGTLVTTASTVTMPYKIIFNAAVCQNATASSGGNMPTSLGAAAVCESASPGSASTADPAYGTVTFLGDASQSEWQNHFMLPSDWTSTGGLHARIKWRAISTTTNNVVWQVMTGCVAAGEASTAVTFNTPDSFAADTNLGTTLQHNDTASTALTTTGCAAGETFFFKVLRDTDTAGDTLDADVQMIAIEFTVRRSVTFGG